MPRQQKQQEVVKLPDPTVEELQAQIDALNAEVAASKQAGGSSSSPLATPAIENADFGPGVNRDPGTGATVIGGASDPRGGYVVAYSDGTVVLHEGLKDQEPFGSVPDGTYTHFFTENGGNTYVFIASDGTPKTVTNPITVSA